MPSVQKIILARLSQGEAARSREHFEDIRPGGDARRPMCVRITATVMMVVMYSRQSCCLLIRSHMPRRSSIRVRPVHCSRIRERGSCDYPQFLTLPSALLAEGPFC